MKPMKTITIQKIGNCARCDGTHENLVATRLTRPVLEDEPSEFVLYTHWAPCPTNGEPILVLKYNLTEKGVRTPDIGGEDEGRAAGTE